MLKRIKASVQRIRYYGLSGELNAAKNTVRWLWVKYVLRRSIAAWNVQGNVMYLDMVNAGIYKPLAIHGIRERAQTILIKRVLRRGQTVLDVGANIGYYALMEAAAVSHSGKVYAFEPFPRTYDLLVRNSEANHYKDIIEAHNLAMGDKPGKTRLYLTSSDNRHIILNPDDYYVASAIVNKNSDGYEYVDVKSVTVDDFMSDREPVHLMRMDVEGSEWKILDGAMKTLEQAHSGMHVFIEVHPPYREEDNQFDSRWEKLRSMGFAPKAVVSARERPHEFFEELGYKPDETIFADGYHRGVYCNISPDDLPKLVGHWPPKIVRYIILEKREKLATKTEEAAAKEAVAL